MPLPRNEIRDIQKMSTPQFRKFLKRYGRNMERDAYKKGYQTGVKDNSDVEITIVLETALEKVKGYGPVMHERMIEHADEILREIREFKEEI